ncbi:YfjI family protein [Nitrosospira sp. Is2]|uniref:YfjI family protein n=1 Tax=Nitrosospira sp. Is2 TaxID=3080532 RepID=UPI00295468CD|nr:DUF3987 domain-containing protein [Nitrosospira sp. Is2]WON74534.1 DUF3987 domain-containing protein [Nitrosospira sp. Is2]
MNGEYEMQGIPATFNGKQRRFVWEYRDTENQVQGYVARFDGDNKKEVIPYFKRINGHGWEPGAAAEPRPLFGLELLAQADPEHDVFVVEGEKAAVALQSMGYVAVTSLGGSQATGKSNWSTLRGRGRVYILPDGDEAGEAYAKATAAILTSLQKPPQVFVVRLPDLPEKGDIVDWIAVRVTHALLEWDGFAPVPESGIDLRALRREFAKVVEAHSIPIPDEWRTANQSVAEWLEPISLESATLPVWPNDVFPKPVQEFVTALSASTETPPELAALMVLAAISTAAHGKYRVQVKDDYSEPVNVWTCVALPPGSRKTSVQQAATAPLTKWEKRQREDAEPEIRKAESDHATLSARIGHLRKEAAKSEGDVFDDLLDQISQLEAQLPEIPVMPQIWAQDVTPENLGTIMAANNERMSILSDESGILEILAGRYSNGVPNLDLFLQGHAGSPVKVNRGSRPSIAMEAPSLTLGLSPQPEVLRGLSNTPSFRGRGLLGRFLYALPSSNLGYRTLDVSPINPEYRKQYEEALTAILNHGMECSKEGVESPHILQLDKDARQEWQSFALRVEAGMREGEIYHHITDWAGKLPGAVIRVAALLHMARHYDGQPWQKKIALQDMNSAFRMAEVLSAHALAVFDLMGGDPALDGARVVLRWIIREQKTEFRFRDCHHAHKSRYKRTADLNPIIEVLVERHFIRPRVEKVPHRPSRIFEVNPAVFAKRIE